MHLAAGLHDDRQRRLHVLGPRDRRRRATSTRRPATRTFTVDTAAPDTTINSGPTGTTNGNAPSFTFSATETGSTFECKLDGPGAATGTYASLHLAAGVRPARRRRVHVLRPRDRRRRQRRRDARDARVHRRHRRPGHDDHQRPDRARPTARRRRSRSRAPRPGSTFECKLDGPGATTGTYVSCTSPRVVGPLADGAYTFSVRATDARRQRRRDARPRARSRSRRRRRTRRSPAARPARPTSPRRRSRSPRPSRARPSSASSTARAPTHGHVRELHLAARPRLAGRRRVHVLGARDRQPRQRRRDAGHARVHGRHRRAGHHDHRRPDRPDERRQPARSTFTATETGSTFECRLDGPGAAVGTFAPCTSPRILGSLADGAYTFLGARDRRRRQRRRDLGVALVHGRHGRAGHDDHGRPDRHDDGTAPSFTFTATEAGSTFECKLDTPAGAGTYAACTSPQAYTTHGQRRLHVLGPRDRRRRQRRRDARRRARSRSTPPRRTRRSPAARRARRNSTSPSFAFTSTETGSTFECKLDGPGATTGTYASCTSPRAYGPLADGAYTFSVRATDAAGNVDATPATRSFTVDTAAPDTTINSGPDRR